MAAKSRGKSKSTSTKRPARLKKTAAKRVAKKVGSGRAAKYVYAFGGGRADGRAEMKNLLGGKGANLAEMAGLGLPVPPGFTITTDVCTYYYANRRTYPAVLKQQVAEFAFELVVVAFINCFDHLISFFQQHRLEALVRLLAVPGAPARRAQPRDQLDKLGELLARRISL